jgi:hypothetical protein
VKNNQANYKKYRVSRRQHPPVMRMFIHILFELKKIFEQKRPAVIHRQRFFPHIFEFCQPVLTLCYKPFATCHKMNMPACRRHITRS